MLAEGATLTSPEGRAQFRNRLAETAGKITDKSLAGEYRRVLLDRFFASGTRPQRGTGPNRGAAAKHRPLPRIARPALHHDGAAAERTRLLTAILLRHPGMLHDVAHAFSTLPLAPHLVRLRDAIEAWAEMSEALDSAVLMDRLTKSGFEHDLRLVLAEAPMPLPACASAEAMPAEAESGWWHIFGFLNVEHLREEVNQAEADATRNLTPDTQRRLMALTEAFNKVRSGEPDGVGLVDA
jgi:DNA primase